MSKKRKALQVSALLSAMGGATLLVAAGSVSVQAAEINRVDERCWDQEKTAPTTNFRLHGCTYGLVPKGDGGPNKGNTPTDTGIPSGGGGGPSGGGGYVS